MLSKKIASEIGAKRKLDITGNKYSLLTAIKFEYTKNNNTYWLFKCDCGNYTIAALNNVINRKHTESCGCLKNTVSITHGKTKSVEYKRWSSLVQRGTNKRYKNYSEKGIIVCDRWLNSFENFLEDMGDAPTPKHSIDRIDNNGNYSKENCRWATMKEQLRNTSRNKCFVYRGEKLCLGELSEKYNVNYNTLYARIKNGWDIEKSLAKEIRGKNKNEKSFFNYYNIYSGIFNRAYNKTARN